MKDNPVLWVIEILDDGVWLPSSFSVLTRSEARCEAAKWQQDSPYLKVRVRKYARKEVCQAVTAPTRDRWLDVDSIKPACPQDRNAFGTPVLIWPKRQRHGEPPNDGFAYYGRRATGRPAFYLHGAEILGVTHWQQMPKGPTK